MKLIACSHVGLIGDALYSLPTIRELCKKHDAKADFYTSPGCAPLKSLMEYQSCINSVIVTENFVNNCPAIGVPWSVGFPGIPKEKYAAVYDLSFKRFPDCPLPEFMAKEVGVEKIGPIHYDYPEFNPSMPYLVMAPRADRSLGFLELFNRIAMASSLPVLVIGRKGEMISDEDAEDRTGNTMLEMTSLIARAKGFIGLLSCPLVIAHGFDIPKAVVFDGQSWDPRHVVRDPFTTYLTNPTAEEVLEVFA